MARHSDYTSIPPETYSREYLLSASLEGYEEYLRGGLSGIKRKQLDMLALGPQVSLLEIGFGRGEFLRHCAACCEQVSGVDYSTDACDIARETLREVPNAEVQVADCRALPFASDSFDRVYSGDVIEHMSYLDGQLMLREAWRVLKPGGFLLIHTSPNSIFMRYVYPLAKIVLRAVNAESVRRLDSHLEVGKHVHLFEFNLLTLRRIARDAGLPSAETWIDSDLLRSGTTWHTRALLDNPAVRLVGTLGRIGAVRFFLGNDLYLRCHKPTTHMAG